MKNFKFQIIFIYFTFIMFIGISSFFRGATATSDKNYDSKKDAVFVNNNSKTTLKLKSLTELQELSLLDGTYVEELFAYSTENLDFESLSIPERKEAFVNLLLPSIRTTKKYIENRRIFVSYLNKKDNISLEEKEALNLLFSEYKIKSNDTNELLSRMISPPTSIILAQAAIESGWGTSRFFKEANNVFGVWSYDSKEPRIQANLSRKSGDTVYLKKYNNINESIYGYILTLSRVHNYESFRHELLMGKSSLDLIVHLKDYSELKDEYTDKLKGIIIFNSFQEFDA